MSETYGCRRCGHTRFVYTTVVEHYLDGDDLSEHEGDIITTDPGGLPTSYVDTIYRCATCGFSRRDATKLVAKVRKT